MFVYKFTKLICLMAKYHTIFENQKLHLDLLLKILFMIEFRIKLKENELIEPIS
jgi:hypothetical protein